MDLTDDILKNAELKRAASSSDLEEIKIAAEIQERLAPQPKNSANIALIIALGTLAFQVFQFGLSTWFQVRSQEDTQWRTAVQTISRQKGEESLKGALNVETFYGTRYRVGALKLVAASLPYFTDANGFDQVFVNLRDNLRPEDEMLMYEVNRAVRSNYSDDFAATIKLYPSSKNEIGEGRLPQLFGIVLSESIDNAKKTLDGKAAPDSYRSDSLETDVKVHQWEIDSLTGYIVGYWRSHGRDLSIAGTPNKCRTSSAVVSYGTGPDLSSTIFRPDKGKPLDMTYLNLSGFNLSESYLGNANLSWSSLRNTNLSGSDLSHATLSGADLRGANLDQADLSNVELDLEHPEKGSASIDDLWHDLCNAQTAKLSENLRKALKPNDFLTNDKEHPNRCPPLRSTSP
jgi:Pentapeptide repeats (8 copies)